MEMFLTLTAISLVGVAVSAALFAAATRGAQAPPPATGARVQEWQPSHFFVDRGVTRGPQIPIEALLLQIERHVRLEQTAAESFVDLPSRERLHSRTSSPLVH